MADNASVYHASSPQITRSEWRWVMVAALLILAVSAALNIYGDFVARPGYHFAGLVYAWEDGQTYLAKIREGLQGEWLYTLAYTASPGPAFILYPNYLFLGHIGAWLVLEPDVLFNFARLFDGAILLLTLYGFIARFFPAVSERRVAFVLATTGGGFGWLTVVAGHPTPDVVQPEMFPFLSILANIHFPLAMAAMLWLLDLLVAGAGDSFWQDWLRIALASIILATTAPFGLITISAVFAFWIGGQLWLKRRFPWQPFTQLLGIVVTAAPFLVLYKLTLSANPSFAAWDSQNLTLSPPPWDYLLAIGIVLIPSLVALGTSLRRGPRDLLDHADEFLLAAWILVTIVLIYLPFLSQQRRFSIALFVPVAILAVRGMRAVPSLRHRGVRFALLLTSSLTNVMLLMVTFLALKSHEPSLFFTQNEWNAILYLRAAGIPHSLVLTSPEMGLFIPAWTGQRVIYGHPVESLDAQKHKDEVTRFFNGTLDDTSTFLKPVDYVFVGPRERVLGTPQLPADFATVFTAGDVQVYVRR